MAERIDNLTQLLQSFQTPPPDVPLHQPNRVPRGDERGPQGPVDQQALADVASNRDRQASIPLRDEQNTHPFHLGQAETNGQRGWNLKTKYSSTSPWTGRDKWPRRMEFEDQNTHPLPLGQAETNGQGG
ncbi:hypothetical protein NE237_010475 [Protea cynaroides]|uniref:Uncharacterized protein n=1 Tax=Protea cynaroides TaxID=273540 RepID=A0A9Q0R1Q0_9MAGN|nr:hypothetical protein NE237_010475 [Protea cynaroides]